MDRDAIEQSLIGLEPKAQRYPKADRAAVEVPSDKLLGFMQKLRGNAGFVFDVLLDHTAIDRPSEGCFELVYNLYSTKNGNSLFVVCRVPRENPVVPTMEHLWAAAHWQEREVFDLFGILYDGHSDLRRLFLEEDWSGYPLRKDYKDDDMLEFEK